MPQPPGYNRQYNLTEYATANPSAPYNAAQHDAEFNAIEATLDQTLVNLTYIQRDDGPLKNGVVTTDSLSSAVAALLATGEGELRGAWLTATAYAVRDVVTNSGSTYICVTAHTSGVFATDLAAGKWIAIDTGNSITAAGVSFSPTGSVAATTVQAAIAEVDSEKLAKASNLSDVASQATAFTNLVGPGGTVTGDMTFSGAKVNQAKGADVASSGTIDLDGATGNLVDVTGTTTITAVTLSAGREAVVRFTGVLTLTHGASLVLPGSANITTAAGDFAIFRGYAAGVVRCVVYSRATGQSVVATASFATFTASSAAGALTVTLQAGVPLHFPDGSVITSSATTVTVSNGSIMGTTSTVAARLWIAAMKNSGTPELAIINTWDGSNVYSIYPTDSISTTAEGGAGAADTAHVWYSTTARSSQPIQILGYIEVVNTAGSWGSPTLTVGYGPNVPLPGTVVQVRRKQDSAMASGTTTTFNDNTIPQSGEVTMFMTQAITPRSALNLLRFNHLGNYSGASSTSQLIVGLFQDSNADALAVTSDTSGPGGGGQYNCQGLSHQMVSGTTSSTTFKIGAGNVSGGQITFNGSGAAAKMNGTFASVLHIEEIMR